MIGFEILQIRQDVQIIRQAGRNAGVTNGNASQLGPGGKGIPKGSGSVVVIVVVVARCGTRRGGGTIIRDNDQIGIVPQIQIDQISQVLQGRQ